MSLPYNPLGYEGIKQSNPPQRWAPQPYRNPTSSDYKPFDIGDLWWNGVTASWWIMTNKVGTVATWEKFSGSNTPNVETFTTNISGPVVADSQGNVLVNASTSTYTDGSVTNTLKTEVQGTSHGIPYGTGSLSPIAFTTGLNDGQLVIGSSIGVPAPGNLTSSDGSIVITNGHNTIDLSTSGTGHNEVQTVTTDDAVVVHPDAAGNLNLKGDATQGVSTTGNDGTATATVHVAHATDPQAIAGSATNVLVDPVGLKAKLGVQTAKGMPYGAGTAAAFGWTNAMTDGQLAIGSTAGTPQAANLTSSDGSVTITNGSNTIDLSAAGGWHYTAYNITASFPDTPTVTSWTLTTREFLTVYVTWGTYDTLIPIGQNGSIEAQVSYNGTSLNFGYIRQSHGAGGGTVLLSTTTPTDTLTLTAAPTKSDQNFRIYVWYIRQVVNA